MNHVLPYQIAIAESKKKFVEISGNERLYDIESIFAMQAVMKTDFAMKVANDNPRSVRLAMINCASTGLTLNPANAYAYLVPRDGAIVLDISYKGLIKIATDTGSISWARADLVHEADQFTYNGPASIPEHKANPFAKDRGPVVGVYCIAKTAENDILVEIMTREEVEKIRSKSTAWVKGQTGRKGPWEEWFDQMAKKAIIKRASKTWPYTGRSDKVAQAIDIANESEGGYSFEDEQEQAHKRQVRHDAALGRWYKSAETIRSYLESDDPDLYAVAEVWAEIPQEDQMDLWLAPSKGGFFKTHERDIIHNKLPRLAALTDESTESDERS